MLKIAITGGIGSGKSEAADYLIKRSYVVIDADIIAHKITASGGTAIPYIIENFGEEYIMQDGSMNRDKMRYLVYSDKNALRLLEEGTTKVVIEEVKRLIREYEKSGERVVFADIPLLYEKGLENLFDSCWLICSDEKLRIKRVKERNALSAEDIQRVLKAQLTDDEKILLADEVIENNGTLNEFQKQIECLLKKYGI